MLKIENLSFVSSEGKRILDNINMEVPAGKIIAVTGPNGGGKTTLAKMISGVEKPSSGKILLDGVDLVPLDPTQRAKMGVSYAFQQPVRFKGITVRDLLNMASGRLLSEEELGEALATVGLVAGDYIDRAVGTHLSGGEIKRIEIAGVLLRQSRVAVFDEPEAGIDLWSFNNLIRVFEKFREKGDCATIIISHQERILSIADEIVMIQSGRTGLSGDAKTIFQRLLCKNDDCDGCCRKE